MEKYKFINNQIAAVGDGVIVNNVVFNKGNFIEGEVDLDLLKKEIIELKENLGYKVSKTETEARILADIVEIEGYVDKKDLKSIEDKLSKCANKLFHSIVTGTGTGVLANLISKAMGI